MNGAVIIVTITEQEVYWESSLYTCDLYISLEMNNLILWGIIEISNLTWVQRYIL